MAFIVTVEHNGVKWPLKGTVWAFDMSRATRHETRNDALLALAKAKPFMKAAIYRKAIVEQVE